MNAPAKPATISARALVHLENVGVPAAVDALAKAPGTLVHGLRRKVQAVG
jgi:hypothetical protein